MPPYTVIKKRADFLAANRGKRFACPGFVLLVQDRRDDDPAIRLGITITKKVGNAVVRNRMRRRFRSLMREMLGEKGKPGADHILIGRPTGIEMDFGTLRQDLEKAFDRLIQKNSGKNPAHAEPVKAQSAIFCPSTGSGRTAGRTEKQ